MATQNPLLPPGQWVQYNVTTQSTEAPLPTNAEQMIGIVRQGFTGQGGPYYQVVWNPGSRHPITALYTSGELTPLSQTDANTIINQIVTGQYQGPDLSQVGTDFTPGTA